jgi:capsular exopolysaccharide synthesis family protein
MAGSQSVQLWDYWFILRKRKLMILATLLVVLLIVTLVNTLQKPVYSAFTELIVEVNQPTKILGTQMQSQSFQNFLDPVFFDTQARLIQSSYFRGLVADELISDRSQLPFNLRKARREAIAGLAFAKINIPSATSARIITISVENLDPKFAALLVNTISKVYIRYIQQSQIDTSRQSLVFLMQKLEDIRDKLNNSAYSISDLDIENQLQAALKVYGERHPIVLELKAKKKAIEESLLNKGKEEVSGSFAPAAGQPAAGGTAASVAVAAGGGSDNFALSRSVQINEELYEVLLKKLQEMNVAGEALAYNVRVIEAGKVPGRPVRPNKRLNTIIGFIMGSVMGVGLAFFREYLDTTIKTVEDLKLNFGLTMLGLIPTIGEYKPKSFSQVLWERLWNKNKKEPAIGKDEIKDELLFKVHRLASAEQLKAPVAEAYRTLRTNLQFTQLDHPLKTLLITSSIRGEGKTTTSVNLGIILAQTGKKILIVDTDLRRPRIHRAFNTGRDVGLTNLLMGESRLEDVVIPADVPNLWILPSGPLPPNPAELVATDKMKALINYMASQYDLVLFDSPPLVAVTDAALLATEVDGLLLVVEAGALPRELLKQGLDRLVNVKANILGAVLNNVNLQKGSYYYYYYHYYHYDYAYADKG